jgi:hypothetical protein
VVVAAAPAATAPAASTPPLPSDPEVFSQTGGKTVIDNVLVAEVDILGGRLGGHGVIDGGVTIGPGGILAPGNSPGTLTINGNLAVSGILEIEIAGLAAAEHDLLNVDSVSFAPGSVIRFVMYGGYQPTNNAEVTFLNSATFVDLANVTYETDKVPAGFDYRVFEDENFDLHVVFSSVGSPLVPGVVIDAVPEPSTLALGALSLALVGWRTRRRTRIQ